MTAVIAAAVKTMLDLVLAQVMPTKMEKRRVNTIKIGSPYFLTTSIQQPITKLIAISSTDTIIMTGVCMKISLKDLEFIAHTHTATVISSCRESSV